MKMRQIDFGVTDHYTAWTITAVSDEAKAFAEEHFLDVGGWQGTATNFTTDWRPARDLVAMLEDAGFTIGWTPAERVRR